MYSPVDGHMSYFQVWGGIVNEAAVSICIQVFLGTYVVMSCG